MKQFLKKAISPVFFLFVEKYTYLKFNQTTIFKLMSYKLRFAMAAKGIFLNANERKLASLKNKYKGQRCFLIGNGPSLNKVDLTKLKNEITFGVNAIYLNYPKMQFHPTYYVVEDFFVAEDRADEINGYKGPQIKFFGTFLEYVLTKDENTIVTNTIVNYDEPFKAYFSKNALYKLGVGGTVTFQCLQLAYYMGFEKIYLVGFDHNYIIPKEANLSVTTDIISESDDQNHFSKDYFGKGYRWHDPKVDRLTTSFQLAKKMFDEDGRKIYNATAGGHLEVFERVEFNDLF